MGLLGLSPGALSQDLVQIQSHGLAGDESFDFGLEVGGQNSQQGIGGKTVLGTLLVVSLGQILEVAGGKRLQVGKGLWGDVSLPLQLSLALINDGSELGVFAHVVNKGLVELQLVSRGGDLATGEGEGLLVVLRGSLLAGEGGLTQVGSEANEIEVFVNVVHDLGLEESLCSIIHDLVAELGFSNVLSQLLDTSAT